MEVVNYIMNIVPSIVSVLAMVTGCLVSIKKANSFKDDGLQKIEKIKNQIIENYEFVEKENKALRESISSLARTNAQLINDNKDLKKKNQ